MYETFTCLGLRTEKELDDLKLNAPRILDKLSICTDTEWIVYPTRTYNPNSKMGQGEEVLERPRWHEHHLSKIDQVRSCGHSGIGVQVGQLGDATLSLNWISVLDNFSQDHENRWPDRVDHDNNMCSCKTEPIPNWETARTLRLRAAITAATPTPDSRGTSARPNTLWNDGGGQIGAWEDNWSAAGRQGGCGLG